MPNEFKLELTVWSKAGLEASTAALDRLHSRGIATHFLENGVLMEELPDGAVRPFRPIFEFIKSKCNPIAAASIAVVDDAHHL